MSEVVSLRVNGTDFGGWKEIEITAGIERAARDFSLAVTRTWPGETDIPRRVKPGDVCEVFIGADKVLTGYVDATPIRYDGRNLSVGVKGRSKTSDLVDCAALHSSGQWRGRKVEQIAADLATAYGITVRAETDTGPAIADHQIQPGETAFECIDRLLTLTQLLAADDADGNLVFISAGSGGDAVTALKLGENILSCDAQLDFKDTFSEYVVKGQRSGSDDDTSVTVAEVSATFKDSTATRRRVLVIQQSGQVDATHAAYRARYERLHRAAKALETTYTVQGWRQQPDGALWVPNQMVPVVDPVTGFNEKLLIVEVAYRLNAQGTTAALTVAPREGFIHSSEAVKKEKKAKTDGANWKDVQVPK